MGQGVAMPFLVMPGGRWDAYVQCLGYDPDWLVFCLTISAVGGNAICECLSLLWHEGDRLCQKAGCLQGVGPEGQHNGNVGDN